MNHYFRMHIIPLIISAAFVTTALFAEEEAAAAAPEIKRLPDKYLVVKVYDREKNMSYQALSTTDYKALEDEIKLETRAWSKALREAEKEWKKTPEFARKTFPRSAVSPRKIKEAGRPYKTMDEAQAKVDKYAVDSDDKDKKKSSKNKWNMNSGRGRGKGGDSASSKKMQERRKAKEEEMEKKRQAATAAVKSMVEKHLKMILNPEAAAEAENAAVPIVPEVPAKKKKGH